MQKPKNKLSELFVLVSIDGSSNLFWFCANCGYWQTLFIVVRYLIRILLIFSLLLNFIYFFWQFFHWFCCIFCVCFLLFLWSYYFVHTEEERQLFSWNICFLCFLQYIHLAFKNPIFDCFLSLCYGRPIWLKEFIGIVYVKKKTLFICVTEYLLQPIAINFWYFKPLHALICPSTEKKNLDYLSMRIS